jgi:pSer/pThr/pTyr-binding forkhead associated (FHA) protein
VGRSDNCELQIDKETLSREHARLILRQDKLFVEDLHSTNGTFVNEQQIFEAAQLRPGDVVRFGQESFGVQSTASDATQMFDRQAAQNMSSSMLVDEDGEEDGTIMLQAISLPAGWEKASTPIRTILSEDDEGLVNALKLHAKKKLRHPHGLLLTIIEEDTAPLVKLLSTENSSASWVLGRGDSSAIKLEDNRISDPHFEILFEQNSWSVRDLDSRNGTYVQNKKIKTEHISAGSEIAAGPYTIIVEPID